MLRRRVSAPVAAGPPVVVTEATPADLPAVRALVAGAGLPLAGLETAAPVLVATDTARMVIGTIALERHGAGAESAFLLRSAAADPAWHGRGVGAALTATALASVDTAGAPVDRDRLPAALAASSELRGACPASAPALLRAPMRL